MKKWKQKSGFSRRTTVTRVQLSPQFQFHIVSFSSTDERKGCSMRYRMRGLLLDTYRLTRLFGPLTSSSEKPLNPYVRIQSSFLRSDPVCKKGDPLVIKVIEVTFQQKSWRVFFTLSHACNQTVKTGSLWKEQTVGSKSP